MATSRNVPCNGSRLPYVVYPLRRKLLQTFLPVTLIPLSVLGVLSTLLTYRQTTQQANIKLYERSVFAAELTHGELKDSLSLLQAIAINPLTQTAVRAGTAKAEAENLEDQPIDQVETRFASAKVLSIDASLPSYLQEVAKVGGFSELFITEKHGFNVSYSHITSDFVQSDEAWWQIGKTKGQWIGAPKYDESSQTVTVELVSAIKDPQTQEFLGLLKGGYDVRNLEIVASRAISF